MNRTIDFHKITLTRVPAGPTKTNAEFRVSHTWSSDDGKYLITVARNAHGRSKAVAWQVGAGNVCDQVAEFEGLDTLGPLGVLEKMRLALAVSPLREVAAELATLIG